MTKVEFTRSHAPAPSFELSKDKVYYQLGCDACAHTISFESSPEMKGQLMEIAQDIKPHVTTEQGLSNYVYSGLVCPKNGRPCPISRDIEEASVFIENINSRKNEEKHGREKI